MTELELKLRLSNHAGARLAQRAAERGQDVAAAAADLIEQAMADSVSLERTPAQRAITWDDWAADMRDWGRRHLPAGHAIDDSREGIYEGRDE